jgi:predicted DNA-binding transcriptional regulator AlpA
MASSRASALASENKNDRFISAREVAVLISYSHHSMPRKMKEPGFPKARRLSPHRIGWLESEIQDYIRSRPPA